MDIPMGALIWSGERQGKKKCPGPALAKAGPYPIF
jgi:hypothetical protein